MKKVYCVLLLFLLVGCGSSEDTPDVTVYRKILRIEYGETLNLKVSDFLSCEDKDVLKQSIMDTSKITYDENTYPAVGLYPIVISYPVEDSTQKATVTLEIQDTIAPTLTKEVEAIEVAYGASDYDFYQHFEATDLSDVHMDIDTSKVNFALTGTYEAYVSATDAYQNAIHKTVSVHIGEKPQPIPQPIEQPVIQPQPVIEQTSVQPTYVQGILVVNKKYGLPASYAPGVNGEAVYALQQLIAGMRANGLQVLDSYSGYRSYSYQNQLYWNYVASYGQVATDTFSARAGHSEHQSGLAFDLISPNGQLLTSEPEASWIAQHAHEYGFIVRYQAGKEYITGYQAEPWHLRYVGSHAPAIYASGLTLEEYLGIQGGGYY